MSPSLGPVFRPTRLFFSWPQQRRLVGILLYGWLVTPWSPPPLSDFFLPNFISMQMRSERGVHSGDGTFSDSEICGRRLKETRLIASVKSGAPPLCSLSALFFQNSSKPTGEYLRFWNSRILAATLRKAGCHPKTIFLIKGGHETNHLNLLQSCFILPAFASIWAELLWVSSDGRCFS